MKFRVAAGVVLVGILVGGGLLARSVLDSSTGGGWSHQAGEAWDAERAMVRTFETGVPNLVLVVDPVSAGLDDPAVVAAVAAMSDELLSHTAITQLDSYWSLGGPDTYATADGAQGLVTARIGGPESGLSDRADIVVRTLEYDDSVIEVTVGGSAVVQRDAREGSLAPLPLVGIVVLVSVALLFLFLRNLAATGFVTLTSLVAVSLTVVGMWGLERLGRLVTVTTPAVVLALAVAWGSATAAGFVFAHRFVAERRAGAGRPAAVVATVGSAGRTAAVATAVAAGVLLTQWLMPTAIVRSTGLATAIAVLAAGVAGVLVLGLLLSLFGAGLATGGGLTHPASRPGIADRITRLTTAHPVVTVAVVGVLLGGVSLLGLVGLNTGETTAESLPATAASREVARALSEDFPADEVDAPFVIGPNIEFGDAPAQLAEYTAALSSIGDVARADSEQGSYVDGVAVITPEPLIARLESDIANLVRAPLTARADTVAAQEAVTQVEDVAAPFRADVGGTTARHVATATAMDARAPMLVIAAIVAILLLATWLLKGWRMAIRLAVAATLSASGAILVVRLGFVEGMLTGLFGSSPVETLDAFAAPVAWTVGLALVAGWLVLAWGAAREAFDHSQGDPRAVIRSLAATRRTHLGAAVLLWLPVVALAVSSWRTQQMIAAAVVGAGLVAVTVGRFVLTPALFAVAPGRLWHRNVDGTVDAVYPHTAASAWLVGAVDRVLPSAPSTGSVTDAPRPDEPVGDDADLAVWLDEDVPDSLETMAAPVDPDAGILDIADPDPGVAAADDAETGVQDAPPVIDAAVVTAVRRRRRARWRRPGAEADADEPVADEPVVDEPVVDEPVVEEPVVSEPVVSEPVVDEPVAVIPIASEQAEEAPAPTSAPDAAPSEPAEPVADQVAEAPVTEEPGAEPDAAPVADADAEAPTAAQMEPEPVAEDPVAAADADAEAAAAEVVASEAAAGGEPGTDEPPAGTGGPATTTGAEAVVADSPPVAAVDVISLTESVIASIEADTPFTTEISSGYVANPSNNLSRVMEAILRDASRRGGEEVLVYGHAAAGRYRWMVVDSGPRADHDPERARTLAEAQRFIRRVGGVVECRPEGDFTVFVVEIPMAS